MIRVAHIMQPGERAPTPPLSGSIGIWVYQSARFLGPPWELWACDALGPLLGCKFERGRPVARCHAPRLLFAVGRRLSRRFSARCFFNPDPLRVDPSLSAYALSVAACLRGRDVSLIHIHNYFVMAPILRRLLPQAKIVLHMHCLWLSQVRTRFVRKALRHVDAVFGCSSYVVEEACRVHPELRNRSFVVPNGTFLLENSGSVEGESSSGALRVLYVGRLSPEKGVHDLIEAFCRVASRLPGVVLDIVGTEGKTPREFLVDLSSDPKIQALRRFYCGGSYLSQLTLLIPPAFRNRIFFHGRVPYERLQSFYREASCVVVPSLCEAFGMPALEAMASGRPLVASSAGGLKELVRSGETGLAVPPGDPESLARAMLVLLSDETLRWRLGRAARRAASQYGWPVVAERLAYLYAEQVLRRRISRQELSLVHA